MNRAARRILAALRVNGWDRKPLFPVAGESGDYCTMVIV
jgi:hypothetical protein